MTSLGTLHSVRFLFLFYIRATSVEFLIGSWAIGGSTVVLLFERGVVELDEDLLINGRASLETLVRVGMGLGRRKGIPASLSMAANDINVGARGYANGAKEGIKGLAEGAKGIVGGLKGITPGGSKA